MNKHNVSWFLFLSSFLVLPLMHAMQTEVAIARQLLQNKVLLEKVFDYISHSRLTASVQEHAMKKALAGKEASLAVWSGIYDARVRVGIAGNALNLPIRNSSFKDPMYLARASCEATYIDEKRLKDMRLSMSLQKYIFLHEAIHQKYNDAATGILLGLHPRHYIDTKNLTARTIHFLGERYFKKFLEDRLCFYQERRADVEALRALGCYRCAHICADWRDAVKAPYKEGYLPPHLIRKIAEESRGKTCTNHSPDTHLNMAVIDSLL